MPSIIVDGSLRSLKALQHQDGSSKQRGQPEEQGRSSEEGSIGAAPPLSKRHRLSGLTKKTTLKTKNLFKGDGAVSDGDGSEPDDNVFDNIDRDPAFQTGSLVKKRHFRPNKTTDKALSNLKSLGKAVVHPVDSVKSKATRTTAGQLSKAERPYLSQKADLEYLEAHDNLRRAESTGSSKPGSYGSSGENEISDLGKHRDKVQELEAHRESLRAAWTISRHVRRVRVVPKRHLNFPENEYFIERNGRGDFVRYKWLEWLGHNLVYYTQDFSTQYIDDFDNLPFDIESSRRYIERLVVASAPWQSWAMDVRSVYRWEDPVNTSKWLAIYLVLWYTQHVVGFLYCYIMYTVLRNRYAPTSVDAVRESMRKALDSTASASKFSELIDKHGRRDWLEPFMESLGPYAQIQLGDIANLLEVFSNFYHWKYPKKTAATLFFLGCCLLVSLLTDMAFCMKIVWFIVGGTFFLCWPIASQYPKYRYLVSPFKWALWDIPTNAEWSFQYLRRQAQTAREQLIKKKVEEGYYHNVADPGLDQYTGRMMIIPKIQIERDDSAKESSEDEEEDGWYSASSSASVLESSDIRSFRAQSQRAIGRLVVYSKGIRFVRSIPKKELWRYDFLDLAEMRKMEGPAFTKMTPLAPARIEIKCIDGSNLFLEGMKERDEAFNTIIAFSGLQWQSLQIQRDEERPT